MSFVRLPFRRSRLSVLVLGALGAAALLPLTALAADAHAPKATTPIARTEAPAPAAASAAKADAHGARSEPPAARHDAPAKPEAAARAAPPAPAVEDPLDRLRERLVERLGARRPADSKQPNVLQVASRATGEMQVSAASHAPRKAASRAEGSGAHGVAAHGPANGHAAGHEPHWSYQGETGPQAWGALKPEFVTCSTGKRQSPIDIRDGFTLDLEPVKFGYQPSGFSVIDNGHTVQVNVSPGQYLEVLGRRYELLQFHFHRPSEERINGRAFDMVAHLVHKDLEGRLAVVAVLLDRGSAHPLVQTVWNNLPLEKGEALPAPVTIDLNGLLPQDRRYFQYMGSLTTPPCTEGVLWMVMQQPVTVSHEQIALFSRLYPMNARPIQSASGRMIKQSN